MLAAERQRERRQKLKETGQYEKYPKKNNDIDKQKYRKRQAEKEEKLPLDERSKLMKRKREKCCKRAAEHRLFKNNRNGRKTRDR